MLSKDTLWHINRKKEIIKKYPQIKNYEGPFYPSFIIILLLTLFQWISAYYIYQYDLSIFNIFLLSFINANTLYHSFGSFIHENSHGLVLGYYFKDYVSLVLELGLTSFGQHVVYEHTHVNKHHINLNIKGLDSECTNNTHISCLSNITNNLIINRMLYLVDLLPFGSIIIQEYMKSRLLKKHVRDINYKDKYLINCCIILSSIILLFLFYFQYYKIILFKLWTLSIYQGKFSIFRRGQSISEHYSEDNNIDIPTRSTYSYWGNLLGFNTGYHDEHHTFPTISWYYLPTLKNIAPDFFVNENKLSYVTLWYYWFVSDFKNTFYRACK